MRTRKAGATLAGIAAVILMGGSAAASSAVPHVAANAPNGSQQIVQNAKNTAVYWKLANTYNILIASTTSFSNFHSVYISAKKADEIVENGGPDPGGCLGYNASAGEYDVRTNAPCSSTGAWDLWYSNGGAYSLQTTIYNYARGDCAWFVGTGYNIQAAPCTGNVNDDKWQWLDN